MQHRSNCAGLHLGSLEPRSSPNRSLGGLWGCRFSDASVPWHMPPLQCTADPGTRAPGGSGCSLSSDSAGTSYLRLRPCFWFVPIWGLANLWDFLRSCRVCTPTLGGGSSSWEFPAALGPVSVPTSSLFGGQRTPWWPPPALWIHSWSSWLLPFFLSVSLFQLFSSLAFTFFLFLLVFPFILPFGGVFLRES